ncbi:MAG TPA: transglycosylase SLT domain-containing protein [Pyrinomonadaceae bacterium]|nr:transglycosylase SLT domain-containing protein [Pyrinomonadaceae bacterium]
MKKRTNYLITLLSLLVFVFPQTITSQETQRISRSSLGRMDVLSRARLFETTIQKAAKSEGVDPLILWTIAYNETRFRPWLRSPKNAQGLMQFMPATAARFGLANPYEPTASLFAAARYVRYLGRLFDWKLESVLAAYNAGEGTVLAYLQGRELRVNGKVINASRLRTPNGVPPYRETVGYVSQGLKVYRWLLEQGRLSAPASSSMAEKTFSVPEAQDKPTISVFYDPRTGKRSVILAAKNVSLQQLDFGPVIVGPSIPTNPAQRARSIFAGNSQRLDLNK